MFFFFFFWFKGLFLTLYRLKQTLDIVKAAAKKIALAVFIWSFGYFNLSLMWLFFGELFD